MQRVASRRGGMMKKSLHRVSGVCAAVVAGALAMAGCSSSPPLHPGTTLGGSGATSAAASFGSAGPGNVVFATETVAQKGGSAPFYYSGPGSEAANGSWTVLVHPLGVPTTTHKLDVQVIGLGTHSYMHTGAVPVVDPGVSWVAMSGPDATLANSVPLGLALSPTVVAKLVGKAPGLKSNGTMKLSAGVAQSYATALSASTAATALRSVSAPETAALGIAMLAGRTLHLTVDVINGKVAAIGFYAVTAGSLENVNVLYTVTSQPLGPAPTLSGKVVSLTAFNKALFIYNNHPKP